ncbi:MAG: hypothetical protein Q4A65_04355 [Bacillota bacterium]|nr:hypothetical protein [Bacillota bacterium]
MNTIDYIANGQNVQFSKKSVTIDDKEFPYIGMSAIKHSSAKQIYLFKYEGKWQKLSYNAEDAQKLKTLFSRIAELNAKRAAEASKAAAEAEAAPEIKPEAAQPAAPEIKPVEVPEETPAAEPAEEAQHTLSASDIEDALKSSFAPPEEREKIAAKAAAAAGGTAEAVQSVSQDETPAPVAGAADETATVDTAVDTAIEAVTSETETTEIVSGETAAEDEYNAEQLIEQAEQAETAEAIEAGTMQSDFIPPEEKKIKLKKGFKIFAAVIALFIVLAIVYFFVVGTSSNPNVGPNSSETQQYDDIDGLIEDLQEE